MEGMIEKHMYITLQSFNSEYLLFYTFFTFLLMFKFSSQPQDFLVQVVNTHFIHALPQKIIFLINLSLSKLGQSFM